ncbi:TrfB-related DNA-binding protein [Burkholderia sp. LMG 13014]|uniref:KfrB domain-containing protein n=1 Tax=Burkholderia sp. LMG 13014 TaxID=2709306 RepID=UPI00196362AD|nr:TrfB-related DNA-binding protein [Burkholderia sp. LMG 13014]
MDNEVFQRLAKETNLSKGSLEAARLVMVDGLKQVDVAERLGMKAQQVSRATRTLYEVERKLAESGQLESVETMVVERNLEASYTMAVQRAREAAGESTVLSAAEAGQSYSGPIVARTGMHVVQDTGRGALVIHELAKLERVPELGQSLGISYSEDLRRPAKVIDRSLSIKRGGISR